MKFKQKTTEKTKTRLPRPGRRPVKSTAVSAPLSEQARWAKTQELVTRSVRWGAWACLGCGLLAMLLIATGIGVGGPAPGKQRPAPTIDTAQQATAGEFAQQFVLTWLQAKRGEEKNLARFVRTDSLRLPATQPYLASDTSVARIEATASAAPVSSSTTATARAATTATAKPKTAGPKTYAVTVAVTVRGVQDNPASATRRYFAVAVVFLGDAARAAALPAEVAAPPVATDIALAYRYKLATSHSLAVSVQQFLAALATGEGDITRYITPGTNLRAITPPPYRSAKLADLSTDLDLATSTRAPVDGTTVRVLATAELGIDDIRTVTTQYALTLTARGGRWEVSNLDPAPLLPQSLTAPTTGPAAPAPTTSSSAPKSPGPSAAVPTTAPAPNPPATPGASQ
ncbi:conjugal transfer protein [Nocardia sp. NPDC051030]|uniref:conjugal transfer protein n=1 Tax=Nocardia sp. NPDC051030 TaxID=3155162 RepID=UPI00343D2BF0